MLSLLTAHASEIASVAVALLSTVGGLWAAFHRLDLLLKARIQEHAASKDDVARLEAKVDILLGALVMRRRPRKAIEQ